MPVRLTPSRSLICLSAGHFLIDLVSAFVVYRAISAIGLTGGTALPVIILYNALAFGSQWIAGMIADRYRLYTAFIPVSLIGAAVALSLPFPMGTVILIGLGNALYHVGAGSLVLCSSGGKATPAGIFIAPGAVGLMLGTITRGNALYLLPIAVGVLVAAVLALALRYPVPNNNQPHGIPTGHAALATGLLVLVVFFRSVIGTSLAFPWKILTVTPFVMAVAVFAGKILGGIVADRKGYWKAGVLPLAIAVILLPFGFTVPAVGIATALLVQMTTAVTLTRLYLLSPNRPGLVFGLTTLAILAGDLPLWGIGLFRTPAMLVLPVPRAPRSCYGKSMSIVPIEKVYADLIVPTDPIETGMMKAGPQVSPFVIGGIVLVTIGLGVYMLLKAKRT
jgi:hypothetical protein